MGLASARAGTMRGGGQASGMGLREATPRLRAARDCKWAKGCERGVC